MTEEILNISDLVNKIGNQVIHDHLNLAVYKGEILGIVGGSGSGKTVLLNAILGLRKPTSGQIRIFGHHGESPVNNPHLAASSGVLFQQGALFSSLTVYDNVAFPMRECAALNEDLIAELVPLKLSLVGLRPETAWKWPEELSGGMIKRVALARALALDPKLLFLDEPTAGLDSVSARTFNELILTLRQNLNLTVIMITHDLETLYAVCDRVAVLVDKKITAGTLKEIERNPHPWIQSYFSQEQR